jgi:hypothetical protein
MNVADKLREPTKNKGYMINTDDFQVPNLLIISGHLTSKQFVLICKPEKKCPNNVFQGK